MKKKELIEMKKLEGTALLDRAKKLRGEVTSLMMDLEMGQLKDIKSVSKKRRDLAQVLTVLRQKQLLAELESKVKVKESTADLPSGGPQSTRKKKTVVKSQKTDSKKKGGQLATSF